MPLKENNTIFIYVISQFLHKKPSLKEEIIYLAEILES